MSRNIDQDLGCFREIVRGTVRQQLGKCMSDVEMIERSGRDLISRSCYTAYHCLGHGRCA
jgi:hypothetical protein